MPEGLQDFDFPDRSDREAIFLLFSVDSLQGNNFSGSLMSANKDTPLERETH